MLSSIKTPRLFATFIALIALTSCGSNIPLDVSSSAYYDSHSRKIEKQKVGKPYQIKGKWYKPRYSQDYSKTGIASWYGDYFHGRKTANGEIFDMNKISAAHKTLPLPSYVEVINLDNEKRLYVRVNDRGPFADGRIIDLSKKAAALLGFKHKGLARVHVRQVSPPKNIVLVGPKGQKIVGSGYGGNTKKMASNTAEVNNTPNKLALYDKSLFVTSSIKPAHHTDNNIINSVINSTAHTNHITNIIESLQ